MSTERGVTCPHCGASTPLPSDLRTPTFACAFCHATLETARFAGDAAVSADALGGYLRGGVEHKGPVEDFIRAAPKFQGDNRESRDAACLRCQSALKVPMDLTVRTLTCPSCHIEQRINEYISDHLRFEADMQRQTAGNAALKQLRAQGVDCPKCGGHNQVPPQASVQFPCQFCDAVVLLSDHVDESAVARQRLAEQVFAMRDDLMAQGARRKRLELIIIASALGVFVVIGLVMSVLRRG